MNKITTSLAASLLLASSLAQAEVRNTNDLTYCLELPTAQLIAKCSGELAPGGKGRTFSKAEVDRILSEQKVAAPAPVVTIHPAAVPAPAVTTEPTAAPAPVSAPAENAAAPQATPDVAPEAAPK